MGTKISEIVHNYGLDSKLANYVGKKICIDAFNVIYMFLADIRGADGKPLKDNKNRVTSHLQGLFYRTLGFLDIGIKPIYVFDGKPNPLKSNEILRRRNLREFARKRLNDVEDTHDKKLIKSVAQGNVHLSTGMIESAKRLLRYMGVPVVEAAEDGESQATYIVEKNEAFAVATQDYDAFLFGAKRIVRNFSKSKEKQKTTSVRFYSMESILKGLEISQETLIEVGIMSGVDFFSGFKGIGAKTALRLLDKHKTIEKCAEYNKNIAMGIKQYGMDTIDTVKEIFMQPNINEDYSLRSYRPNSEKIIELLVEEHNFNRERIEKRVNKFAQSSSTMTQTTLGNFVKKVEKKVKKRPFKNF